MSMAVQFTHETDYIYRIKPENWEREIRLVTEGLKNYNPVYLTTDDALKIVRTTKTSFISGVTYEKDRNQLIVTLKGISDIASSLWVFTEKNGNIIQKLIITPAFEGTTDITTKINQQFLRFHHTVLLYYITRIPALLKKSYFYNEKNNFYRTALYYNVIVWSGKKD